MLLHLPIRCDKRCRLTKYLVLYYIEMLMNYGHIIFYFVCFPEKKFFNIYKTFFLRLGCNENKIFLNYMSFE